MIRLRHTLERARRHPSGGSLALIVLLLLLVLIALKAIHDGQPAVADAARICLGLLAVVALARPALRRPSGVRRSARLAERAPPRPLEARRLHGRGLTAPLVVPLRR